MKSPVWNLRALKLSLCVHLSLPFFLELLVLAFGDTPFDPFWIVKPCAVTIGPLAGVRVRRRIGGFRVQELFNQHVRLARTMNRRRVAPWVVDALPCCLSVLRVLPAFFDRELGTHTHTHCVCVCVFKFLIIIFNGGAWHYSATHHCGVWHYSAVGSHYSASRYSGRRYSHSR